VVAEELSASTAPAAPTPEAPAEQPEVKGLGMAKGARPPGKRT
jgi:hypothetical protein